MFLCSDEAKDLNGRVMSSHGGKLGNKIVEFTMRVSEGWQKDGGMATFDEIKANLDKILMNERLIVLYANDNCRSLVPMTRLRSYEGEPLAKVMADDQILQYSYNFV